MPCPDDPSPGAGSSTTIKRSSSSGPTRRRQLWILPDRTRRCSRTVLAALVVHLMPALNATRRAALPPSDVPPHAGSPFARCHNNTRRAADDASPVQSAAPRAAVRCAGRACRICCRGGRWESKGRAGCFLFPPLCLCLGNWDRASWEVGSGRLSPRW